MTTQIKAIQTRYKGHLFRSRLEARWAVFYDSIGEPWEYEKEGFNLRSGLYLPDFWMPKQKCWIEIKGQPSSEVEQRRACDLCRETEKPIFIFDTPLSIPGGEDYPYGPHAIEYRPIPENIFGNGEPATVGGDYFYQWCSCGICGAVGIQFEGRSDRLPCKKCYRCSAMAHGQKDNFGPGINRSCAAACQVKCIRSGHGDKSYNYGSPKLIAAYESALSARFEHGQSGAN